MKIILASKSPRRIELLSNLGLTPMIYPAEVDEDISEFCGKPEAAVMTLSLRKAEKIAKEYSDSMIIAADTLVYKDKVLLGKPENRDDAKKMLFSLSGEFHSVYTGITVIFGGKTAQKCVETKVKFKKLSKEEIDFYISTGEPLDKAGAYGIQGIGSLFVEKIDGDYFNVVGLPVEALFEMIKESFGIRFENLR